jgi:hypothetical protein
MNKQEWLEECEYIVKQSMDWSYASQWYSFENARKSGMTPYQAAIDCIEWLNDTRWAAQVSYGGY